jgi:5-(carboxyamino)imidazole ribonucleotide synthase
VTRIIQPGSTIGVLGSGQLGRMFTIAARRMGYRVHVLSPDDDTPTGQVADVEIEASYDDLDAVARFARSVEVVTFEFENVPVEAIERVEQFVPVCPNGRALHTTQHRLREKSFFRNAGLPVTPFQAVRSSNDLKQTLKNTGRKAVLKTAAWGYDGIGQQLVEPDIDHSGVWSSMNVDEAILEEFVDFERELSVVAARGFDGQFAHYEPITNVHKNHILDVSVSPADIPPSVSAEAVEIARAVMEKLEVVGVLCVEFFLTRSGNLLINELAPRPHNSGHLTIDAHVTCQFEQQVRAVCGLPLGSSRQLRSAAMANLLGNQWQDGDPQWSEACALPDVKLHLYGKRGIRPGRKMGHLTALAETPSAAMELVREARRLLTTPKKERQSTLAGSTLA